MNIKDMLTEAVDGKIDLLHKLHREKLGPSGLHSYYRGNSDGELTFANAEEEIGFAAPIYCWDQDILGAVLASTESLPDTTTIQRHMSQTPTGWWWFGKWNKQLVGSYSLPEMQCPKEQHLCALGYKWHADCVTLFIYTYDHNEPSYGPVPVWMGVWKEDTTVQEYLADNRSLSFEAERGIRISPGKEKDVRDLLDRKRDLWNITGALVARFFIAANLWLKQTILEEPIVATPKPAGKRAGRAGIANSTIRYVRLRKSIRTGKPDAEAKQVNWTCQWRVEGFWRNQYFATKKGTPEEHQLIWINEFVKGPEGLPLKVKAEKIFRVDR